MNIVRWGKGKWHITGMPRTTHCGKPFPHDAERRMQNHRSDDVNWSNMCTRCFD